MDHPDTVNAAFVSRHADGKNLNGLQKMNIKHELAKNLLSTHYSHLKSALDTKAVIQHEADMEEWDLTLDGVSSAEDVDRYVFFLIPDFVDSSAFIVFVILFLRRCTPLSKQSGPTLAVMFP